ncbi:hypothetical protein, partial [Vibrio parahaemolyticus]
QSVVNLSFEILKFFVLWKNYQVIKDILGPEQFLKVQDALKTKFIKKLVPFLGPACMLVAFSTAIMGNYDRLTNLIECSASD